MKPSDRICISVQAETISGLVDALVKASGFATWVEARADVLHEKLEEKHLRFMRKSVKGKIVFTCRSREEGGVFSGTEQERIVLLEEAASAGLDLVDVEYASFAAFKPRIPRDQLLLSHHDFSGTPSSSDLQKLLDAMSLHRPAVRKVATMVNDADDLSVLLRLMIERPENTIIIGMGEKGKVTRVLGPMFGAPFTYASLSEGGRTAPGQYLYKGLIQVSKSLGLLSPIS